MILPTIVHYWDGQTPTAELIIDDRRLTGDEAEVQAVFSRLCELKNLTQRLYWRLCELNLKQKVLTDDLQTFMDGIEVK